MKNDQAFTLVELLVTVAIVGILASTAIANYQTYRSRAYQTQALSLMKNVYTGAEVLNEDYPVWYLRIWADGTRELMVANMLGDPLAAISSDVPALDWLPVAPDISIMATNAPLQGLMASTSITNDVALEGFHCLDSTYGDTINLLACNYDYGDINLLSKCGKYGEYAGEPKSNYLC